MPIWAEILGLSDLRTPWLDSHPGPQFQYHGGQNTFVAYQWKASGSGTPGTPSGQASGCFWSRTLPKLPIWAEILWVCQIAKHPGLTAILVFDSKLNLLLWLLSPAVASREARLSGFGSYSLFVYQTIFFPERTLLASN